ncbi:MAG: hypothetical protein LOD91_07855 [Limnochordales bacterium]|nr:hypothetical protein [Limnochordales bacterium]
MPLPRPLPQRDIDQLYALLLDAAARFEEARTLETYMDAVLEQAPWATEDDIDHTIASLRAYAEALVFLAAERVEALANAQERPFVDASVPYDEVAAVLTELYGEDGPRVLRTVLQFDDGDNPFALSQVLRRVIAP